MNWVDQKDTSDIVAVQQHVAVQHVPRLQRDRPGVGAHRDPLGLPVIAAEQEHGPRHDAERPRPRAGVAPVNHAFSGCGAPRALRFRGPVLRCLHVVTRRRSRSPGHRLSTSPRPTSVVSNVKMYGAEGGGADV